MRDPVLTFNYQVCLSKSLFKIALAYSKMVAYVGVGYRVESRANLIRMKVRVDKAGVGFYRFSDVQHTGKLFIFDFYQF